MARSGHARDFRRPTAFPHSGHSARVPNVWFYPLVTFGTTRAQRLLDRRQHLLDIRRRRLGVQVAVRDPISQIDQGAQTVLHFGLDIAVHGERLHDGTWSARTACSFAVVRPKRGFEQCPSHEKGRTKMPFGNQSANFFNAGPDRLRSGGWDRQRLQWIGSHEDDAELPVGAPVKQSSDIPEGAIGRRSLLALYLNSDIMPRLLSERVRNIGAQEVR